MLFSSNLLISVQNYGNIGFFFANLPHVFPKKSFQMNDSPALANKHIQL